MVDSIRKNDGLRSESEKRCDGAAKDENGQTKDNGMAGACTKSDTK
ncbi:MAG: hypothetical protein M3Z25_21180 [Actinomycetota bacterium]|nr:hypothetical protein [Actinomycetota bacterium]